MYPNHYYPVWRTILRKFDRYILSQLMVMFGFFALVLVSVYWVNNTVKVFDRLISDGHSAAVVLEFTLLLSLIHISEPTRR